MKIAGMVKNSFVDYPAHVACVVFTPGCNYSCFYCHNRALIHDAPSAVTEETLFAFLHKRAGMLDGVVVTGGEPTLQADLVPFLERVKALGYLLKLDTNGSRPEVIESLLKTGLCDYFAVDYKAPQKRYAEICGRNTDAGKTLATIGLLLNAGAEFEVRTTVFPQLSQADLLAMAAELPQLPRYVLNRYRKPETYLPEDEQRVNQTPYTPKQVEALAEQIRKLQPNVTV